MSLPRLDVSGRIPELARRLRRAGVSAIVVTKLENVRYLTGYSGSAGVVVVKASSAALFLTDGRYEIQAARELARAGCAADLFVGPPTKQVERMAAFLSKARRVAIESTATVGQREALARQLQGREILTASGWVEQLRRVKDEAEVSRLRAAARAADAAFARVLERLEVGVAEKDLAAELDYQMRLAGAAAPAFDTIVASGPNAALPHAKPSSRRIREGDVIVFDFGAVVDGYHSDMTRTVFVGDPAKKALRRFYEVVLAAQEEGLRAAKVGVPACKVDSASREVIKEHGLGDLFVHSTGHGVGLEIHELPWVSFGFNEPLRAGEAITVEPGVYKQGIGGVRIEDTIVVREEGPEVLTRTRKELVV
jgi:Xaa-Pro aminopeptidase